MISGYDYYEVMILFSYDDIANKEVYVNVSISRKFSQQMLLSGGRYY